MNMNKQFFKFLFLSLIVFALVNNASAQKKPKRTAAKRTTTKTTKNKTKTKIKSGSASADVAAAAAGNDSIPIPTVKKSLRRDASVDDDLVKDRTPLTYEHLRADDAVYRHKIWREIDTREKMNLPFRYSAKENNGDQRFIFILLKALQDDKVTAFNPIDDRFTTPMTKSEVAEAASGAIVKVPKYDPNGNELPSVEMRNEMNFDSIYKFRIKEEVVFDKESSRLFFRVLGIAPVKRIVTAGGIDLGETEMFWVYYPDMREIFAKYEVYNGKNFGARMSWEELFESRMFYGRIIKSTIDNPYDQFLKDRKGLSESPYLQLLEGETIKEKIFNYEQDLWSY
jgi:gliding motility associated protien GldN